MAWQIGVDVGGTFTDLLALDPECGVFRVAKVLSTPEDQSIGFIAGLARLDTDLAAVAALVHGTTVATNAVLERKGARCGLITTAGFRDVLELGRRTRPNPYGMTGSFEALIPRDLRAELPERIDAAGRVLTPLDEAAVRQEVHRLRRPWPSPPISWRMRSAWFRSRRGTIRATSRCSPLAPPVRCTPSKSPASSGFPPCWCRAFPASPRVWVACSRRCDTILSKASASRSPTRRPQRSTAASPIRPGLDSSFSTQKECRWPKSWLSTKSICCSVV